MTSGQWVKIIFAHIVATLLRMSDLSEQQIGELARRILDRLESIPEELDWSLVPVTTVSQAMSPAHLFKPVRVVARSLEVGATQLVDAPPESGFEGQIEATYVEVTDQLGDTLLALDVLGPVVHRLRALARTGRPVEVRGVVIAMPLQIDRKRPDLAIGKNRQTLFISIFDGVEIVSALDQLGATLSERQEAADLCDRLKREGLAPGQYLREELVENLCIVREGAGQLLDLVDVIVLQGLSQGFMGNTSQRVSALVVGAAGSGKKLLSVAAHVLSSTGSKLSAAKITPAGLVGGSFRRNGRYVQEPGALPSASGGVATLEDAHGLAWNKVQRVSPILQEVMESGVVSDSVLGGGVRPALTSILVDVNRVAQFDTEGGLRRRVSVLRRKGPRFEEILKTIPPSGLKFLKRIPPSPA